MRTAVFLIILSGLVPAVQGQQNPPVIVRDPFPALTGYLGLNAQQVVNITRLNAEFAAYLVGKTRRATQVQLEIRQETQQESVNPTALGVRYYELEAICREAKGKKEDLTKNVQAVLTAEQKPKFQTLQGAFGLFPVIAEAQGVNLMGQQIPGLKPPMANRVPEGTTLYWTTNWSLAGAPLPGCQAAPAAITGVILGGITDAEPE
jgi:hypothetical protein